VPLFKFKYFLFFLFFVHHETNALFAWLISHQPAVLFSHNKPATSNQPSVLFSQNKSAPAISHQPNEQAANSNKAFMFWLTFPFESSSMTYPIWIRNSYKG
jgi:hypothetical protein